MRLKLDNFQFASNARRREGRFDVSITVPAAVFRDVCVRVFYTILTTVVVVLDGYIICFVRPSVIDTPSRRAYGWKHGRWEFDLFSSPNFVFVSTYIYIYIYTHIVWFALKSVSFLSRTLLGSNRSVGFLVATPTDYCSIPTAVAK